MIKKFRWKPDYDLGRRNLITKKIKSILKEEPVLPEDLFKGYYTDFIFKVPSGSYRFYYAGGDTSKGGIYFITKLVV